MRWALGLMSGTSLDAIDAALVKTDGKTIGEFGPSLALPLEQGLRDAILQVIGGKGDEAVTERAITLAHAEAVKALLRKAGLSPQQVAVVGFHGQTVDHRPEAGITRQLGDGGLLAEMTGIDVVADFRRRDVAAGGQGAPLVPLFHAALAQGVEKPVAFLNIGGIANITFVGSDGGILAFDTGPGNVLLNTWMERRTGSHRDEDGKTAAQGRVDEKALQALLSDSYFQKAPPKSLDRQHFSLAPVEHLSTEDGAATLTAFTASAVAAGLRFLPEEPKEWLACGGGRHNVSIIRALSTRMNREVKPVEDRNFDGDMLEAQAFAYLAVRSLKGLPLSLPTTTGAKRAVTGGAFFRGASAGGS